MTIPRSPAELRKIAAAKDKKALNKCGPEYHHLRQQAQGLRAEADKLEGKNDSKD